MPRRVDNLDSQANLVPATRYVATDAPLHDPTMGVEGGITMIYTGTTREHPWTSRKGEQVMDGKGVAKCLNGDVYEGDVRLGMFHGDGLMTYANGNVYEGQWRTGLREGYGVLDAVDGSSYTGLWYNGEKDGLSEESGKGYHFMGVYRDGFPEGTGRIKLDNGDIYDAVYHQGRLHGLCTIAYAHGDVFVGTFVHGHVQGTGKYTQIDTEDEYTERFEQGVCVQGVLEPGTSVIRGEGNFREPLDSTALAKLLAEKEGTPTSDSTDAEPTIKTIKEDIMIVQYHSTGDVYEGEWKRLATGTNRRGVRHGYGKMTFAKTGDVYEGEFRDDLREGFGTLTFANRKSDHAAAVNNGVEERDAELTVELEQNSGGSFPLRYEGDFHNDLCDGKATVTMQDGMSIQGFWTRGERNGLSHAHPDLDKVRFTGEVQSAMFTMGDEVELDYHKRVDQEEEGVA